jgi:UPF0755 protein
MVLLLAGFFLVYFWIRWVGDTIIKPWTYSITQWDTFVQIPEKFDIEIQPVRYKLWLRFFAGTLPKLQAGSYTIEISTELRTIFDKTLARPAYTDITITILPGWNMYDIDDYLSNKKIIAAWSFLLAARDNFPEFQSKYSFLEWVSSLEGFLYPDTYRILPTADSYMIIERLLKEWDTKIGKSYKTLGKESYNSLILASIVEREERVKDEKPIVAGILAKRVKEGIAMWADATVCYGYAKTQKQCTPDFIGSVIGVKHPYNTRNKQGYPPTPISSISSDTWQAVVNKSESPYYFYLHDDSGKIHYGKTLEEHNANKRMYLQ